MDNDYIIVKLQLIVSYFQLLATYIVQGHNNLLLINYKVTYDKSIPLL